MKSNKKYPATTEASVLWIWQDYFPIRLTKIRIQLRILNGKNRRFRENRSCPDITQSVKQLIEKAIDDILNKRTILFDQAAISYSEVWSGKLRDALTSWKNGLMLWEKSTEIPHHFSTVSFNSNGYLNYDMKIIHSENTDRRECRCWGNSTLALICWRPNSICTGPRWYGIDVVWDGIHAWKVEGVKRET